MIIQRRYAHEQRDTMFLHMLFLLQMTDKTLQEICLFFVIYSLRGTAVSRVTSQFIWDIFRLQTTLKSYYKFITSIKNETRKSIHRWPTHAASAKAGPFLLCLALSPVHYAFTGSKYKISHIREFKLNVPKSSSIGNNLTTPLRWVRFVYTHPPHIPLTKLHWIATVIMYPTLPNSHTPLVELH